MARRLTRVDVSDLVRGATGRGTPWAELNCSALAREVLRRLGRDCPWIDCWTAGLSPAQSQEELERILARVRERWEQVPAPCEVGDLVLSAGSGDDFPYHLSVLVDLCPRRALTSSKGTGAVLVPPERIARILGVWRWRA